MNNVNQLSDKPWMDSPISQTGWGWGDTIDHGYPELQGRDYVSRFRFDPVAGKWLTFMGDSIVDENALEAHQQKIADIERQGGKLVYYRESWPDGIHYFGVLVAGEKK